MGVDVVVDIEVRDQYHPRNNPQLDGGGDPPATLRPTHRNPIDPLDHLFTDDLFLPVLAQPYHTL